MLRYIYLVLTVILLTCGCSNKDLTGPFWEIPNAYELAEMEDQIDTEDWWIPAVYEEFDEGAQATFVFTLPVSGQWSLTITDRWQTRIIREFSGFSEAGEYEIVWNLKDENGVLVPPGIYWHTFQTRLFTVQRKMLILYGE